MKAHYIFLILCVIAPFHAIAKSVSLQNNSTETIFGAIYHTNSSYGLRKSDVVPVEPGKVANIELPCMSLLKNRMLYVDKHKENLPQKIDLIDQTLYFGVAPLNVNFGRPTSLIYVESVRGPEIIPANEEDFEVLREELRKSIAEQSRHYGAIASVSSTATELCNEEARYVKDRQKISLGAAEKLLGQSINVAYAPHVTLCVSGGGFRAMLATLGVLQGLDTIGMLSIIEYATSLSGGSWALIPWIMSKKSIHEYAAFVTQHIGEHTEEKLVKKSLRDFNTLRHIKALFGNSTGLPDLYSLVLSKRLLQPLKDNPFSFFLSHMTKTLDPACHPYPLCSAVIPYRKSLKTKYTWVSMSPWNIEMSNSGHSIPTWAFMRHFNKGKSIDFAPEPWLGYFMGIWGSAFSVSLQELLAHTHERNAEFARLVPKSWVHSNLMKRWFGSKQCTAIVPNFTYGMENAPYKNDKTISLIDAGHYCNLPVIPLTHPQRNSDLVIIVSNSINAKDAESTWKTTAKALQNKYPRMTFNAQGVINQPISYWPSPDIQTPSIIYITIQKNRDFHPGYDPRTSPETKTFNFWYTKEQAEKLIGLMKYTIEEHKEMFINALGASVKNKKEDTSALTWIGSNLKALF
ncbi:MAG: cytosolic phospholipase [Candidatus Dependentiae bacterium]|nr:cytosolic phospholipase [Candidatus Dependentiae bacterium]